MNALVGVPTSYAARKRGGGIFFNDKNFADMERRSPVPPAGWSFEIGQRVEHVDGGFPGKVVGRSSGSKHGEFNVELTWVRLDAEPGNSGNLRTLVASSLVVLS